MKTPSKLRTAYGSEVCPECEPGIIPDRSISPVDQ